MSIESMALVLHHSRAKGTDKLVLLGIANHAGDGGAWPTVATLARYANVSERAVQQAMGKLVSLGELAVHRQAGGMGNLHQWERPNRYDVLVACPITCDHTANHRQRQLPEAPADLWIEGVKPASPGEVHVTRGVKHTSPGGVKPASPKPSLEPDTNQVGRYVTVPREAAAPCSICSLPAQDCIDRARTSGHSYSPTAREPREVVDRARRAFDDVEDDL